MADLPFVTSTNVVRVVSSHIAFYLPKWRQLEVAILSVENGETSVEMYWRVIYVSHSGSVGKALSDHS